jgi:hypothetical protein
MKSFLKKQKAFRILPSYTTSTLKEEEQKKSPLEKDNKKVNKKEQTKFIYS